MGDRGRRWICGTIVVAVLAACSGGDDDDAADTEQDTTASTSSPPTETTQTTVTSTTTTTAPQTPEGQITADYLAYWTAYDALAANPGSDADVGAIAEHASGQALDSARQAIGDLRAQGQRIELGPVEKHNAYSPSVIDPQTAYVADCHVADAQVLDANGGVVRGDPPEGRPETIAVTLVRGADRWLVDSLQYYDLAPGETCSENGPTGG